MYCFPRRPSTAPITLPRSVGARSSSGTVLRTVCRTHRTETRKEASPHPLVTAIPRPWYSIRKAGNPQAGRESLTIFVDGPRPQIRLHLDCNVGGKYMPAIARHNRMAEPGCPPAAIPALAAIAALVAVTLLCLPSAFAAEPTGAALRPSPRAPAPAPLARRPTSQGKEGTTEIGDCPEWQPNVIVTSGISLFPIHRGSHNLLGSNKCSI